MNKPKVGFLLIGTNKYADLAFECATSIYNHINTEEIEPRCIFFSNSMEYSIDIPSLPWPLTTLFRYHYFIENEFQLNPFDYLMFVNADMRFKQRIGKEILSDLVGCVHPGYYNTPCDFLPYERNPASTAYIPYEVRGRYYFGALQGGRKKDFLEMCGTLKEAINKDLKRNLIAQWHDESHLNRYFIDHPPTLSLDPGYAYPEGWNLPFNKKIEKLSKDHAAMRSV